MPGIVQGFAIDVIVRRISISFAVSLPVHDDSQATLLFMARCVTLSVLIRLPLRPESHTQVHQATAMQWPLLLAAAALVVRLVEAAVVNSHLQRAQQSPPPPPPATGLTLSSSDNETFNWL